MNIFEDRAPSPPRPTPLRVAVLGCTGSIGRQALDVARRHPERVEVTALSVYGSTAELVALAREFRPSAVAVADRSHGDDGVLDGLPSGCGLFLGDEGVMELASLNDVDCVLVAVVGEAGIHAAHAALAARKVLACANKEALVAAGDLLMPMAEPGRLIPVDSEHSAIYQCLVGGRERELRRIWLTCSGGPFLGRTRESLASVTPEEALGHPTWAMGPKITVDSATLMNKGLEVIEAHHLFDVPVDAVEVLVHPQSKIHSMVEFADGSTVAQLGPSDMRIPIQYAFSYPHRWDAPCEPVDWRTAGELTFGAPDTETFRCLALALQAGRVGGTLPCAMNAANEVANQAFRDGRLGFLAIAEVVSAVMDATVPEPVESLAQVAEVDARARAKAAQAVSRLSC